MMKMKMLALMAICVIAVSAVSFAAPASAAQKGYLIDHGTKYFKDAGDGGLDKITWKTYWYSKNTRKVVRTFYFKNDAGKWINGGSTIFTMNKVSKTKLKLVQVSGSYTTTSYIKTKKTTRQYYWYVFRPKNLTGFQQGPPV